MKGHAGTCHWCRRGKVPAAGAYLGLLYPGEFMCRGCGRRERFCDCGDRPAATPAGPAPAVLADPADRIPAILTGGR